MNRIFSCILCSLLVLTSCDNNNNSKPEISIKEITVNNQITDSDSIEIGYNDTLKVYLELNASLKDINSFTTKFKDLKNYKLEISEFDKKTTYIEGNSIATALDEDCTILFKDGTYQANVTISTIINDNDKDNTKLYFYLFSEEETDIKDLEIKLLRQ